jgi:O-antigen ligase
MPRRVKLATFLAFLLHGILILTAGYRMSYDAYNHMFFASHYQANWWSLWEPRWYTGFEVVSYPPLVHQLMALLGHVIGVDHGFALLLWIVLTAYPLAVYQFCRIFAGRTVSSYAAYAAVFLPSIFLTAHVFGQLPTLFAALLALFASAVLAEFLRDGGALKGALAIALFATVIAAHHATLLLIPWLIGAVVFKVVFESQANLRPLLMRLSIFGVLAILAGWVVIFPFWKWGAQQTMQTPIDHASRHNFIQDPFAAVLFFLPVYGLLIPMLPFAVWIGLRKRFLAIGLTFLYLYLIGLGGTTPLPQLLFGQGWAWLTYDRFSFWASLLLLLFVGVAFVLVRRKLPRLLGKTSNPARIRKSFMLAFSLAMGMVALLIGRVPYWLPTQPAQVDLQPIVEFLNQPDHSAWRYITFGFGDQFARLSLLTKATTIDGSYHTARTLPELRASGIGQIDSSFWLSNGLNALDPILQKSGEHGVRWGFVNLELYDPVLERNGWQYLSTLPNGVQVWENPAATLPPRVEPPAESLFTSFAWGTFPLLAFFLSAVLAFRRYAPMASEKVLPAIQALAIGLLPLSLSFWYFHTLFQMPHKDIYFTYTDALLFLSDVPVLIIVLIWLVRGGAAEIKLDWRTAFKRADGWLFALCLFASLSMLWSLDWRISLYLSLHLWLCFALYLALSRTVHAWRWFAYGACAALFVQIVIGIWQFATQSTAMTAALQLNWPGSLIPDISGASVVQLPSGERWLRVYGTLAHPNLLGGWTLAFLVLVFALFLASAHSRGWMLVLINAGLVLLVLTFSRSSWGGLFVMAGLLLFHFRRLDRKRLVWLAGTGVISVVLLFTAVRPLVATRFGAGQVETEKVSLYTRSWLMRRTREIIQKYPILGVGAGAYTQALYNHVTPFNRIEPVHNLPVLVLSELGLPGLFIEGGLALLVLYFAFKSRQPLTIVLSAGLVGLLAVSFFDHYFWTISPGRVFLAAMLGLWAGEVKHERGG